MDECNVNDCPRNDRSCCELQWQPQLCAHHAFKYGEPASDYGQSGGKRSGGS